MNPQVDDEGDDGTAQLAEFFGDGAEELEAAADPFEAPEAEDPGESEEAEAEAGAQDQRQSGPPKTVPYKRLQHVISERNAARQRLSELEAKESELRAELSGAKSFRDAFSARYGKFRNPTAQLALDADFMSAMEALAKNDPDVGEFYQKVMKSMGQSPQVPTTNQAPVAEEPAKDVRLDRVIEKYAEATIKDVLAPLNLQDRHQKLIQNYVLQHAKDLATLDPDGVKTLARKFIHDSGFTLEEMRKVKETPVQPAKPRTAARQGGAAPAAASGKSKAAEPKTFKNREDYLNHRRTMVDDLIAELMVE